MPTNPSPSFPPLAPEPLVTLLPAREAHAELWWRWRQEPATRRHNALDEADVAQLARRLADSSSDLAARRGTEYRWLVALAGQPIGMVALGLPSWLLGEAVVSVMIGQAHQGCGHGRRAMALLCERAFAETPLTRLVALISEENRASIRLVERLGFERAGRYPDHYVLEGRRVSQLRYVLHRAIADMNR